MAQRCVALFRGINVGKAKRLGMADLRALFEGQGLREVRTLLNSGNVVFTAPRLTPSLAPTLRQVIHQKLKVDSRITIITANELTEIIRKDPLNRVAKDHSRYLVGVLADPGDRPTLLPLAREDWTPEQLSLGPRVAYLWLPHGTIRSKVARAIERALGDRVTSRNWATMLKLQALAGSAD